MRFPLCTKWIMESTKNVKPTSEEILIWDLDEIQSYLEILPFPGGSPSVLRWHFQGDFKFRLWSSPWIPHVLNVHYRNLLHALTLADVHYGPLVLLCVKMWWKDPYCRAETPHTHLGAIYFKFLQNWVEFKNLITVYTFFLSVVKVSGIKRTQNCSENIKQF